jgi:hypothetical protein
MTPRTPKELAAHTPTPWRMHDMEHATIVAGKPGGEVANCLNGFGDQDANAQFIIEAVNSYAEIDRRKGDPVTRLHNIAEEVENTDGAYSKEEFEHLDADLKDVRGRLGDMLTREQWHIRQGIIAEETIKRLGLENKAVRQLLAHTHLHLTNDENFSADEFERDLRALDGGEWIDTETLLQKERIENDRLRSELAQPHKCASCGAPMGRDCQNCRRSLES